jgi:hypothetical protein
MRPLPPTWVLPSLPPVLDDLLRRGLADLPHARLASAREMLGELHRIARSVSDIPIPFAELRQATIPTVIGATVTRPE